MSEKKRVLHKVFACCLSVLAHVFIFCVFGFIAENQYEDENRKLIPSHMFIIQTDVDGKQAIEDIKEVVPLKKKETSTQNNYNVKTETQLHQSDSSVGIVEDVDVGRQSESVLTQSASETNISCFLQKIREIIEKNKRYPRWARRQNYEGVAVIGFYIGNDGDIISVRIIESTGYDILDREAIATIKKSAPFPVLSENHAITQNEMKIEIAFFLDE